jgi:hypothetical protein
LADAILERIGGWNRRTLDPFAERAYFYASFAYEKAGKIEAVRSRILAAQRTACLHHYSACQATLLNLLLRSYQSAKLFVQADKLLAKSTFPETASNAQLARFLYYNGRIKALQLEYSEAHRCLLQVGQHLAPLPHSHFSSPTGPFPYPRLLCLHTRTAFYNGRNKAVQLEYSEAHRCLLQVGQRDTAPSLWS